MYMDNDSSLGLGKTAVVMVDMQDGFVSQLRKEDAFKIIGANKRVLDFSAERDIPLYLLQIPEAGEIIVEFRSRVEKIPRSFYFSKSKNSGFSVSDFDEHIRARGFQNLLITGVHASYCVFSTARDAVSRGYTISSAEDLIADGIWINRENISEIYRWFYNNGSFYSDSGKLLENVFS